MTTISLDTETTGVDMYFGTKPFFVTVCNEQGEIKFWEWPVDPLTRQPIIPQEELDEITAVMEAADWIVGQNIRFDAKALDTIGISNWPWDKTHDTLVASHILESNGKHNLTSLAYQYLGRDIRPCELALEDACTKARTLVRRKYPQWRIAKEGLDDMPSVSGGNKKGEKDKLCKNDMHLPACVALWESYPEDHPWWTVLRDYSNTDSAITLLLWKVMEAYLKKQDLWEIYLERMRAVPVAFKMVDNGASISKERLEELENKYLAEAEEARLRCIAIAAEFQVPDYSKTIKIISGGQTGVDQAALIAAKEIGFRTGGSAPKGWRTTYGPNPDLGKKYGLKQLPVESYPARTKANIRDSDCTLQVYEDSSSPGELLTSRIAQETGKPLIQVDLSNGACPETTAYLLQSSGFTVVNVAGNSEDTCPGITDRARIFLKQTFGNIDVPVKPFQLDLPAGGGRNSSLNDFVFKVAKLPTKKRTASNNPALDKYVLEEYEDTLPHDSRQLAFIKALRVMRTRGTYLTYLAGYKRFWLPTGIWEEDALGRPVQLWYCIHSNLNQTGTATLRWSSSNPNTQNIGKKESECATCSGTGIFNEDDCLACAGKGQDPYSLRYCFGPAPGREWYSIDAKNIERRIPAYEADEKEIIELLNHPERPPYYGSEYSMVGHLLYPGIFESCKNDKGELDGRVFKKKYSEVQYKWAKGLVLGIQYGCQKRKADATAHLAGAYDVVKKRFWRQEKLNQKYIQFANKYGYVETIPDKTVNPRRGYPLLCSRTEDGHILPTTPLNYHVSGTAMWITQKAMIRCQQQLDEWNRKDGFDGFITLQVHDELVFDFPKVGHPVVDPDNSNLWRIKKIHGIMEALGDCIGIPTPMGIEYHEEHWGSGVTLG